MLRNSRMDCTGFRYFALSSTSEGRTNYSLPEEKTLGARYYAQRYQAPGIVQSVHEKQGPSFSMRAAIGNIGRACESIIWQDMLSE